MIALDNHLFGQDIEDEEQDIIDESSEEDTEFPLQYDITSWGVDFDVDGIIRRYNKGDIFIPPFQRDYVWTIQMASRFIESLLLGLPVPGIFLAKENESNKMIVIDGQQRIKSLAMFKSGYFAAKPEDKNRRVFALTKVQDRFNGCTYDKLDETDRLKLADSIIHATVIKQDNPADDDTSIYHIFERLNNGGMKLAPQEIRTAIYHGQMIDLVRDLNDSPNWRKIYGKQSPRLKDQELILRFFALHEDLANYKQPMLEFLNRFAKRHRNSKPEFAEQLRQIFYSTTELFARHLGENVFRPERALNAAVLDSMMVGAAFNLPKLLYLDSETFAKVYFSILEDNEYSHLYSRATSDENNVRRRIEIVTERFRTALEKANG